MLYQLGPVTIDVFPLNADEVHRSDSADYVRKGVLGRRKPSEFVGPGEHTLKLKGKVFPYKPMTNGLPELEILRGVMRAGEGVFVMRGDGEVLGWHTVDSIDEVHTMLAPTGVGQEVTVEIKLTMDDDEGGEGAGLDLLGSLLDLFG